MVTEADISRGLDELGIHGASCAIVHSSLRSFGPVEGGALTACRALHASGATLLFPAGCWDLTGVPAPPGLLRPDNVPLSAASWEEFDRALAQAVPYSADLPVDRWLGVIPETMRRNFPHARSPHPLMSYLAVGPRAGELTAAGRLDWALGPLQALADLDGDVLMLGTDHTTNTTIHLAEQNLGRSLFFRYAKAAEGVWMELPNIPGESHRFDEIEPFCRPFTQETMIGACRARRIRARDVLAITEKLILEDPFALLCDQVDCRCYGARQQRLRAIAENDRTQAT